MQFAPNAENNERAMLKRMEHEAHALFSKTGSHRTAHTLFWHTFALVSPDMPPLVYLVISIVFRAGKCNTILLQLRLFPLCLCQRILYIGLFLWRASVCIFVIYFQKRNY